MPKIEAVIFDWAGTTVDFGSTSPVSAFMEAFRRAGVDVTDEETRAPMGLLKRDHIRTMLRMPRIEKAWSEHYGRTPNADDVEALYADFEPALMAVLPKHCDIKPFVLDAVHTLREKGIKIGSTTGFTTSMMEVVVPEAAKAGYSPDTFVTADDTGGFGRPWPYMVFENMRRLGLADVRRIVKVGDTVSDMREGKNAGLITVGVTEGSSVIGLNKESWDKLTDMERFSLRKKARETFFANGADFVIDTMAELPKLIEAIEQGEQA
ncbi:phosphonoacetaldehyde hydrolase [Parasutterella secunda]|uniref:Phosphonoacetaldehyde hydrolase n=1 Tax=Parasutterella secunda TaxID=626947 RepID=A0ABS2GUG7_9BURK|nr:phosphonoacetaldehyde hydrolase [Parasutterella secunda]MBM6928497.1 phosphonoacetaldehyde hydrolase [Parasutterella secunda]